VWASCSLKISRGEYSNSNAVEVAFGMSRDVMEHETQTKAFDGVWDEVTSQISKKFQETLDAYPVDITRD